MPELEYFGIKRVLFYFWGGRNVFIIVSHRYIFWLNIHNLNSVKNVLWDNYAVNINQLFWEYMMAQNYCKCDFFKEISEKNFLIHLDYVYLSFNIEIR